MIDAQTGSTTRRSWILSLTLGIALLGSQFAAVVAQDHSAVTESVAIDSSVIEVDECLVRFASEIRIPALETGRVAEINVALNEMISSGTTIARLNDRSLLIQRRSAQLRLDS